MNSKSSALSGPGIHLICGPTGAGKSTYANKLSNEVDAVHLSIDDWMTSLFGPDIENPMDWGWISERAIRCEERILSLAIALAQKGTPSILEIGLQRTSRRSEVISVIKESGCTFQTHLLLVDAEERWRRVQQRNNEQDETFRLTVTKDIFDFFEGMWEAPSTEEQILINSSDLITE